jgi:peptide chain release factor subunit 1
MTTITIDDFNKVDVRVGRIVDVQDFPEARKPAWKLTIDFGPELGTRKSSAQLKPLYTREELIGTRGTRLAKSPGMPKTTTALETPLRDQLDRLAAFEPVDLPVISLYLDMQRDQNGRSQFDAWLRKTLAERQQTFKSNARQSFDADVERIKAYLEGDVQRSANGLAIFACNGANLFEAVQLTVPIDDNWLFIGPVPHLYPLARLNDQYPRYAALLVDTNSARLFVFSLGTTETMQQVQNVKTRKTSMGGWSQARYQRHIENYHSQHIKEVVDILDRVVREEAINQIVVSCDEVAKPLLMEELPQHLKDKVVDVLHMDIKTPDHEVLNATLDALRAKDTQSDQEHVEQMIGAWRGGGLAVVGPEDTLDALQMGQVEELIIAARPSAVGRPESVPPGTTPGPVEVDTSAPNAQLDTERLKIADELVTKAQATSARIRFIENEDLLADVGGVGAILRFKI